MKTKSLILKLIVVCLICIGSVYILTISAETNTDLPVPSARQTGTKSTPLKAGTWIKYHIKRNQKTDAGFKTIWESDLKISVVDEKKQKTEHTYEIELVANENTDNKRIVKFFVTQTGEPLLDKLVIKNPNLNPLEIDLNIWSEKSGVNKAELFKEILGSFLIVPFSLPSDIKSQPDKLKISIKDKTESIDCQRYIMENPQEQVSTKIWVTKSSIGGSARHGESPEETGGGQLPFPGVVKELIFEDSKAGVFQTLIIPLDYDTKGAATLIKERPVKLNFKEKK